MTVKKVIPCVCTVEERKNLSEDEISDPKLGMPMLIPYNAMDGKQFWCFECPRCGRGGLRITEEKSAYKALMRWNKIQKSCYALLEEHFY